MIKRDTLQRAIPHRTSDGAGGNKVEFELLERVPAHVSITSTIADMTQYGVKDEWLLHTVTDYKLDTVTPNVRYIYSEKVFQIMRQVKQGNEWFQVLREVNADADL